MPRDRSSRFHTTHWSLIVELPGRPDQPASERAREALEHLCNAYWKPLYAFARHSGCNPDDAQDITQAFLARIIETGGLQDANPDRGRFRSYLLGAMKHFMANERSRARTQKRGGNRQFLNHDIAELESRIAADAIHAATPTDVERAFDRDWARETTAAAIERLAAEWTERGRDKQFIALKPTLTGEGPTRTELAERLGMSENALAVAIHRLRQRYATLVREAVAQTVADKSEIEDEMRYLVSVLREN